MSPAVGPVVAVQPLENSSIMALTLALLSGVVGQVDWALNQLSILSFRHDIPTREQRFPHVLSALEKTVETGMRVFNPSMNAEQGIEPGEFF